MALLSELQRRNVFRVAATYAVSAWLLVQVSTTVLPLFGAPEWVLRALVVVLVAGAIPLLILAWAFELTPEGLKTQAEADAAGLPSKFRGPRMNLAIGALLLLSLALFALGRYSVGPVTPPRAVAPAAADAASIAVLPFVNMSADKDNEYFSDGLSETLLDMLVQVPGLKVPARTSSFAFKGKSEDVRGIATALGVAHLLEGSVQKAGDTVRITAQLIRASDGVHIWSRRYDRKLTDVFAIQDEIATEVVGALKVALLPEAEARLTQKRTDNVDAYEEYLRGIALMPRRRVADLRAAAERFERAITLDPTFAKAYVGAADAYRLVEAYGTVSDEERARGRRYVARALELAPELGEAHTSLGASLEHRRDPAGAEREYRRGIELAPSYATAHHWYAELLRGALGRYDDALAEARRAVELDPLSPVLRTTLAESQAAVGAVAEGRATIAALVRDHPDFPTGHFLQALIAASEGDLVTALRSAQAHDRSDPNAVDNALGRCNSLVAFRALAEAEACTAAIDARVPGNPSVLVMQAELALRSGRAAEALAIHARAPDRDPVGHALALWALDRVPEALEIMRRDFPFLFLDQVPEIRTNIRPLALVSADMLLRTGAESQGRALVERALKPPGPQAAGALEAPWPWSEVVGHAILGDTDAAIAALDRAIARGSFVKLNDLEWAPQLAPLRADPRYEPIVAPARAKAAEQVRLAKAAGLL